LLWKDYYFIAGGPRLAVVRGVGYALLVLICMLAFRPWAHSPDVEDIGAAVLMVMLLVLLLEAALLSARVFREEIRGQTWQTLMMLPRSLQEIAYGKLGGCAIGLAPAVGFLFLGALLAPELVGDFLDDVVFDDEGFFVMSYFLTQVGLFLHLAALFSVSVRWAAWPVAIFLAGFVVIVWNMVFIGCLSEMIRGPEGAVFFVLAGFGAAQVGVAHWMVGQRLTKLAGE
jgi:ABC-type transport system involved in multi-copper enzyme maturation permease subunit